MSAAGEGARRAPLIDPSGRPLKRAGFEAAVALAIVLAWFGLLVLVIWSMGKDRAAAGPAPSLLLGGIGLACWWLASEVAGRHQLVWPGSALGLVGPLSLGFAIALATPELRTGTFQTRIGIVSTVSALAMVPFLFRYRLPGLVSPIITFLLVGLFIALYGSDMQRLRAVEGFSPRGLVAALMGAPGAAAAFGAFGVAALLLARRLDLHGDDFGLAAARPLHLVGGGITALVLGRMLAGLPAPLDLAALALAWLGAWAWVLRINRFAVLVAIHFAMVKPLVGALTAALGVAPPDLYTWSAVLWGVLIVDFATWPLLHRAARAAGWTLGPGGVVPPLDRPGWLWRYWPYATDATLDAWAAGRERRRITLRRPFRRRREGLSAGSDRPGKDPR